MKSALSSALTSALSGKEQSLTPEPTAKSDGFSFPCLSETPQDVPGVTDAMDKFDLNNRQSLPGSARQTSLLPNGRVGLDYDLDRYRRRSGKEKYPSSFDDEEAATSAPHNFLSEAVVGSLPKPLSLEERSAVLRNTPLSPTLNLLSSMPNDRVTSRNRDGKKLRRHVLRGAVLVIVTAGYSGKKFVFEKAKELGVRMVVIDGPDSWSQTMVKEGLLEKFYPVDFADTEHVFDRCAEAIQRARKELGELDGILSFCEIAQPLVARLTEKFGLPGSTPAAVDAARDKYLTRQAMGAAGLPTPRNFLITADEQLDEAAAKVGFPAVIKPIFGAASIGVQRVDDLAGLKKAYKAVMKELKGAKVVAGAITQGDGDDGEAGDAGNWIRLEVMMEEYLDGPEVDVDVIMSEGLAVYGAVSDNWPTIEPYFNETGSNAPSILPKRQQRELVDLAIKSVQALGFVMGVFHVECKYTSRGARLIEVNCRMGGGPVRNLNMLVWGVDMVEEQFLLAAGIPSRPPVASRPLMYLAEYSINSPRSGVLQSLDFLEQFQNDPKVLYARPIAEVGSKVIGVEDGMPSWVCECMVADDSVEAAIAYIMAMEKKILAALEVAITPNTRA